MKAEDAAPEPTDDYKRQVDAGALDPFPYDRLMITYRKEKQYKDELRVIERALRIFQEHFKRQQQGAVRGGKKSALVKSLSQRISQKTGLTDKKGQQVYTPEPIARWLKRKETVEEKIRRAR